MKFSRVWAMPTADTFNCEPINGFVKRYLMASKVSIDPFARNSRLATFRNDLNPNTAAEYHLDAEEFLGVMLRDKVAPDLVIFDPPYSYRQVVECYDSIGREFTAKDQQQVQRWTAHKAFIVQMLVPGGVVLSFGWSSTGMGKGNGFELKEVLLVNHGSAHNDTICIAERRIIDTQGKLC